MNRFLRHRPINRIAIFLVASLTYSAAALASPTDGVFTYNLSSVASITGYAQEYTDAQLVIPDEVTFGGVNYTVTYASGLDGNQHITEVVIGPNLQSCETFRNCRNLQRFTVDSANPYIMVLDDVWLCQNYQLKDNPALWTLAAASAVGDVTIPQEITSIYDGAFNGCDIDCLTFTNCVYPATALIDAAGVYDDNHEYLGWETLGKIRQYALADNLTQWNNGFRYFIEGGALYQCYYNGFTQTVTLLSLPPDSDITTLIINSNCDEIASLASKNLRNLVIPSSVTKMGDAYAYGRDYWLSSIKNIIVGEGLSEVYLPTVNNVVKNVYCKATTPPAVNGIISQESETEVEAGGVEHLYVPEEGYEAYCSHESWGLVPDIAIYDIEAPGIGASTSDTGTTVTWHASNVYDTDHYTVRAYGDAALEQLVEEQTIYHNARSAQSTSCTFEYLEPYTDYWVTIEGFDYDAEPCFFDYLPIHTGATSSITLTPSDHVSQDTQSPAIYDLTGRRLPAPTPGLNLILSPSGMATKHLHK
ncbi:MAG: leucine-rich repeat domain-containing protein [Bacteroidales bacterium]|nr:leucine-rich repeat domain-containing protein [Bacteroidales bacterium]